MSGVAEMNPKYLMERALNAIPVGYKQSEVGIIPEDWETKPLGELVEIYSGDSPSKFVFSTEGTPYFKVEQLNNGSVYADSTPYFIHSSKKVLAGSVIFPKRGASILSNKIRVLKHDSFMDTNLMALTCHHGLDELFLYNQLTYRGLDSVADTTSIPQINNKHISPYLVPLPRKAEQTAIANALSDVDALISELEKLIAKKQAIKTATMQQLLTGRTRLPQFALREDGTKKGTKKSELGEIPEDWKILAMGDLGSTYGGLSGKSKQDFGHGNSLYVPFTNVMANVVVDVDNLEKVDVRETQNNLALGDLLFNGSSETPEEVCFSALVSADIRKLYLNSFCFGFRSNQKNAYLPLYLAYWFRSEVGRAAVLVMAQGSTRYNISKSQFMKLPIVLPDTEEQTAIATILSDMDAEIQALNQRLSKTRQIKQGMMQELLTGKTRLVQPVNKESQHD
ncbi:restriction endonuclease subunit S [Proteus mirabilis]|uniref:restriction endonuclease subunit S n=1 Tax=Proteus mirabilis TaxID=584 RepID=UPI002B319536|nr:restriction endonuclease subunit S [Proteus mirabilis]